MDRRQAIAGMLATGVGALTTAPVDAAEWLINPYVEDYGLLPPLPQSKSPAPLFQHVFNGFTQSLPEKNVFLYHDLQKEVGDIVPHVQPGMADGGEGDCVGHAIAMACDILSAGNIHRRKKPEAFVEKASVEAIYWGSRNEIGGGRIRTTGSRCVWGAMFVQRFGVLHRLPYVIDGRIFDLRGYDSGRSRDLRNVGVPDYLEPVARYHPVRQVTKIANGLDALQAVAAGQPVVIGSTYAFPPVRDEDGFTTPYLSRTINAGVFRNRQIRLPRKQWRHAMVLTGAIFEGKRKGGVLQNSFGAWNEGPKPYDMPDGAFGVELKYLDMMVKDHNDAWALSGYVGHRASKLRKV